MTGRFFLDTNIFVYSFDRLAADKCRRAKHLIREAVKTGKGVVSYQVVQEFFSVTLRRFSQPMTTGEAEQYLDVVFRPLLNVHSSPALYTEALHLTAKHRLSWYDALIVAGAKEAGCSVLYSEDLQHGYRFAELEVQNPFHKSSAG